MAGTTTNYGWTYPTSTDLVKDGATAIQTLATGIDTTSAGSNAAGLVFIKSQTIGSAVTSVTVTGAFSTTYDAYKIIVNGGVASGGMNFGFRMGTAATGYYSGGAMADYASATITNNRDNNGTQWSYCGYGNTNQLSLSIELNNPFLTKNTFFMASYAPPLGGAAGGTSNGFKDDTASYTSFTILSQSAVTMTGGNIAVYGYRKAI